MHSTKWKELNENFAREYSSYRNAKKNKEIVRNSEKVSQMVADALKISGHLYNSKNKKKLRPLYKYEANGRDMPLGLAPAVLAELPDPANFTREGCANFYFKLVSSAIENRLPGDLFLQALNYSHQLLNRFQDTHHFNDTASYESLEKKLRQRLIKNDCAKLIVQESTAEHVLVKAYRQSLRRVADTYLRHRDYAGAIACLVREIEVKYPDIPKVTELLHYEIMFWAHYYNNLLGVLPPLDLFGEAEKIKAKFTEPQRQAISDFERIEIDGIEMSNMTAHPVDGFITPNSSTCIVLTIPATLPEGEYDIDGWKVSVASITDPFTDPNFRFIHRQAMVVNGMPMAVLSPALWQTNGVMLLEITSSQPFHPDLDVKNDGTLGERRAKELRELHGESYDPYLTKVIELLCKINNEDWPNRKNLISSLKLIDSYYVEFISPKGTITHHEFRPLVKLSAFLSSVRRFKERFAQATNKGHEGESLKKLVYSDAPMNAEGLLRYTKAVFRELIARKSEHSEWWKTVWVDGEDYKKVRDEPDVGREISHIVSDWFRVKGLTFDREVRASGGSIDMLVASAHGSQIHRCGIELKYAHHNNVISGVSHQLPDYMDDLEAETGIFLTLWCKGKNFPQPAKYDDISELVSELRKNVPEGKEIEVISVNTSYRPPPSKRR